MTKIKHVTDQKNHSTLTKNLTEKTKNSSWILDHGHINTTAGRTIFKKMKTSSVTRRYRDVNKNEVKTAKKITVEAESKGNRKK